MQAHELLHFPTDKMLAENGPDILINQSFMYLLGVIGGAEGLYRSYGSKPDPRQNYHEDFVYLAKTAEAFREVKFNYSFPNCFFSASIRFSPQEEELYFDCKLLLGQRQLKEHLKLDVFEMQGNILVFEAEEALMKRIMGEFYDETLPLPQFEIKKDAEFLLKVRHWYSDHIKEGRYLYAPCQL